MKFFIEIESDDQPGLIAAGNEALGALRQGMANLNTTMCTGSNTSVRLRPASDADATELYRQRDLAKPKPQARWVE